MSKVKTRPGPSVPAAADPSRDDRGRFLKGGPPANPNGRPRAGTSLSERIRATVDKDEMIRIAVEIMRGNGVRVVDVETDAVGEAGAVPVSMPTAKDQLSALNWLASYAWSKPPAYKHVAVDDGRESDDVGFDVNRLSDEGVDQLERLLAEAGIGDDGD